MESSEKTVLSRIRDGYRRITRSKFARKAALAISGTLLAANMACSRMDTSGINIAPEPEVPEHYDDSGKDYNAEIQAIKERYLSLIHI